MEPDLSRHEQNSSAVIGYGWLAGAWLALVDLTGVSVLFTRIEPGRYKVLWALAIACVKAGVVIAVFMHMRSEGRLLRWFLFVALATLSIFIGFTFFDVLYR